MTDSCAKPGPMTIDEAHARLLRAVVPMTAHETIAISEAAGRVLAQDQYATVDVPPADNSAMDGFALRLTDLLATSGHTLPISQRIPAGISPLPLVPGTAARIFTGAEIPAGADTVVIQENCTHDAAHVTVQITPTTTRPRVGDNIRSRGQDMTAGTVIVARNALLGPAQIGVLAATGIAQLPVWRRLRVAIFSTGDELLEPGSAPEPGRIYNSNRYALRAYLALLGVEVIDLGVVADRLEATIAALQTAAQQADLVITTGGASVGEEDHLQEALTAIGQVDLWKVAIKPGKPLLCGHVLVDGNANARAASPQQQAGPVKVPVLGLPGNPVSVAVTFLVFAVPLLRVLQGAVWRAPQPVPLPANFQVPRADSRTEYLRVRVVTGPDGIARLERFPNQSSGVLTSMAWADGFAVVPAGTVVSAGDPVGFLAFSVLLAPF